jgi:hypothetical protein
VLRDGLIENHMGSQPKRAENAVPEIAKTNP